MIDLLIAGGGPAGLATGIHAALAGMRAVVVEPRPEPVDKACGEGLMPGGVRALRRLGVDVPGQPLTGIRYLRGPYRAEASFRGEPGLGARRTVLHSALYRRAVELGVTVVEGRVGRVGQSAEAVTAAGLRARWLVAADGLHSPVRRALGLQLPARAWRRYGLRRHFRVRPWTSRVEVHWSGRGEAYVTPVGPELVGVAVLSSERRGFQAHLACFPELCDRLAGSSAVSAVRGAGPLRQRVRGRVAGRVLLVGDAGGYVDALTGEGVALALASAEAAVACLVAGRPEAYEQRWRGLSRRHRWLTAALVGAACRPGVSRLVVPAAARMPAVFAAAVHALR